MQSLFLFALGALPGRLDNVFEFPPALITYLPILDASYLGVL